MAKFRHSNCCMSTPHKNRARKSRAQRGLHVPYTCSFDSFFKLSPVLPSSLSFQWLVVDSGNAVHGRDYVGNLFHWCVKRSATVAEDGVGREAVHDFCVASKGGGDD
jgi:hypothetical protein